MGLQGPSLLSLYTFPRQLTMPAVSSICAALIATPYQLHSPDQVSRHEWSVPDGLSCFLLQRHRSETHRLSRLHTLTAAEDSGRYRKVYPDEQATTSLTLYPLKLPWVLCLGVHLTSAPPNGLPSEKLLIRPGKVM